MKIFGKKFRVLCGGSETLFEGLRSSYRPGEPVMLRYGTIATDTNYSFTLDGEHFSPSWEKEMFVLRFIMPDHDVELKVTERNTMCREERFDGTDGEEKNDESTDD